MTKSKVCPPLYEPPQKGIIKNVNQAEAFINIAMYVFPPPAQKIITLRDSLSGGFKNPQALTQLLELTNLDWREWEEERIIINVDQNTGM